MLRHALAASIVFGALLASPIAEACRCLQPTIASSYNNHDHVFAGRVLSERRMGQFLVYEVRVTRDGKSCLTPGSVVEVSTYIQSATCGTRLPVGSHTLIFADDVATQSGQRVMQTNSCAGNRAVNSLTADEIDFLRTRFVSCTGTCLDPQIPVYNCLIDPCDLAPACADGTCSSNYCGGCNYEFFDSLGYEVCVP